MHHREVYKRVFTPIAEQRIREQCCPNCGLPKSEWKRSTTWRCCSKECTANFWKNHAEIFDWNVTRAMVFKRDNYTCKMCDRRFVNVAKYPPHKGEEYAQSDMLIGDHVVPIAVGGSEFDMDNIQTLCIDCNKIKTKRDMQRIAKFRKRERELKFDIDLVKVDFPIQKKLVVVD